MSQWVSPCPLTGIYLLSQAHFMSVLLEVQLIAQAMEACCLVEHLTLGQKQAHICIPKSMCPQKAGITFEHCLSRHVTQYRAFNQ